MQESKEVNKILWSPQASRELLELTTYLIEVWGVAAAGKLQERLIVVLDLILTFPMLYPASAIGKGVRKCVLTKQTSLYYRVVPGAIEIVTLRSNKMENKDPI